MTKTREQEWPDPAPKEPIQNLAIWDKAEKTDPHYTKGFSRTGGFKGTAINGTYIVKRLTELFGPCGMGWKVVVEDDRYTLGALLNEAGDRETIHCVRGHLDYRVNGEWYSTGSQFGQTTFVGANKNGTFTDEEAPKKSITDLTSKLAVLLGIGADIHLGMYDDSKYLNEVKEQFAKEPVKAKEPAKSAATPKAGALDFLTPEQRREMEFTADEVTTRCRDMGAKEANEYIASFDFDTDHKVALWSLLDSKTRAAIKAATKETA